MATFIRVQHNFMTTTNTAAASFAATLGSGVTAGNLLVATVTIGTNLTLTAPSGWAVAGPVETVSGSLQTQIYYLIDNAGGDTSWTWSWTGSHSFGWTIDEWNSSTGWHVSPVDSSAGAASSGGSTAVNCGSPAATTQASELWYGVLSWANNGQTLSGITPGTWTTGDTAIFSSNNNTNTSFYQTVSTTGTPSLAATISASEINAGVVATFMPTGAASAAFTSQQPQRGRMIPNRHLLRRQQIQPTFGIQEVDASVTAGLAAATGTAYNPAAGGSVTVTAGLAAATGTAYQALRPITLAVTPKTSDQVATVSGVATSTTSFTPVAGGMIRISATWLDSTDQLGKTFTCADNHSNSYAATLAGGDADGGCYLLIFDHVYVTSPGSTTVVITAAGTGATATADCLIQPYQVTGQGADQSTAAHNSFSEVGTSTTTYLISLTTTQTGSQVSVLGAPNNNNHPVPVPNANTVTDSDWDDDGVGSHGVTGHSAAATGTPGATTFGWTSVAASIFGYGVMAAEILPVSSVTAAAGLASATGAALAPAAQVTAFDQTGALGTGAAFTAGPGNIPVAGPAAATGAALAAAIGTSGNVSPVAGLAAATGAAIPPLAAQAAPGTGTAYLPGWGPGTQVAVATGAALNATITASANAPAGLAAATGAALSPAPGWGPQLAAATGAAPQPVAQVTGIDQTGALATGAALIPVISQPVALNDVTVTANQVVAVTGVATSTTSFSPGAGSMALIEVSWLFSVNATATVSCKDSLGTAYTAGPQHQDNGGATISAIFTHTYASAPGAITVTVTATNTGTAGAIIAPHIITSQAANQSGATSLATNNGAATSAAVQESLATTKPGSYVYLVAGAGANATFTAISGTTTDNTWNDATVGDTGVTGRTTSVTGSPGVATMGWTSSSAVSFGFVALEVLPIPGTTAAAGVAAATGTASPPAVTTTFTTSSATAAGAAQVPAPGWVPVPAAAAGTALQAAVVVSGPKSVFPTAATATGAGQQVTAQATAFAGPAAGTGAGQPVIFYATSPALVVSGFGSFPQVPLNASVLAVIANITQYGSDAAIAAPLYELWNGVSTKIGLGQLGTASTVTGHVDSLVFTGVSYNQLATLQLRVYARSSQPGNSGATVSVDAVSLSVEWGPSTNVVVTPKVRRGDTKFPAPAISAGRTVLPAVLAKVPLFPTVTTGTQSPGIVTPLALAAITALPRQAVSTGMTVLPGVLARVPVLPAVIDVTAPGWASAEAVLSGGNGSWTSPGNITGSPDGSNATWTVP
jgi:hypothetical protein